MEDPPELDATVAERVLRGYGLAAADEPLRIEPLGGGVSSVVLLAEAGGRRFVLKQPRTRFRVPDECVVDARRIFVEHAFVRTLAPRLASDALAPAVAFLPQLRLLVLRAAPPGWEPWKARLLAGRVDGGLAEGAAELLGAIHSAGGRPELDGRFRHSDLFDQQRLDPYFRAAARRAPLIGPQLDALCRAFGEREDLVHGDFSPKNLLTDGRRLQLVDHEVATRGDAAFDVAFLLTHLVLKSLHVAPARDAILAAAARFVAKYEPLVANDDDRLPRAYRYLGGLLVARVVGKSPVEYLTPRGGELARSLGQTLLHHPVRAWPEVEARVGATLSAAPAGAGAAPT